MDGGSGRNCCRKTTAIYYAASTEQNGPGLALGKHIFIAHYAAQRIAEELGNALVYPTMPYAPAGDPIRKTDMRFPGTVSVSEETLVRSRVMLRLVP